MDWNIFWAAVGAISGVIGVLLALVGLLYNVGKDISFKKDISVGLIVVIIVSGFVGVLSCVVLAILFFGSNTMESVQSNSISDSLPPGLRAIWLFVISPLYDPSAIKYCCGIVVVIMLAGTLIISMLREEFGW